MTREIFEQNDFTTLKGILEAQSDTEMSDTENPAFTFSQTSNVILCLIADGSIDARILAKAELANRGLDQNGIWVGFDRAEKIHFPEN